MTATADLAVGAPGWHRDPGDPRHITYWDGARWTVHMRWDGADWQRCDEPHDPPPAPPAPGHYAVASTPAAAMASAAAMPGTVPPAAAGPAPSRRSRRRLYGLLAVLLLVAGAAGGAYELRHRATSTGTVAPPTASSAQQVLGRSLAAARSRGSAHLTSTESAAGIDVSSTYDISTRQGRQTISGAAGNATVLATPGAAYVLADATFLQGNLGLSAPGATKAAGTWIEFRPADPGFRQIVSGVTLASALAEATPTGTLRLTGDQIIDGQRVVGISGGLPRDSVAGASGRQVLYVEAAAPYLPVELDLAGTMDGQSGTSKVTFSGWGESVPVSVPAGAVPASSLGS